MQRFIPFILSFSFLLIISFFWDEIKLPYDNNNIIVGEYYYKKYNPLNDTVRFLIFILVPCLIYLISYLKLNKETYNLNRQDKDYFLNKKKYNFSDPLKLYFLLFIFLIIVEFCSLDFTRFIGKTDLFHDGTYLVPPLNYLQTNFFFRSTFYDYGFFANNLGLISNYILGYYNLSSVNLTHFVLILLIKFFLILILKKITTYLSLKDNLKKIFFIILCFIAISLPNYYDTTSFFSARSALYLSFIFLLGSALCDQKNVNSKFFFSGTFSIISILWWWDIGAYVNAVIFITIIYLLIHREIKNIFLIFLGIISSWSLFFLIMPSDEIKEFFYQIQVIYSSTYEYFLGIEYRKPFSLESGRWTKALILIYISSLMLINFNLSKKYYIDYRAKIFTSLTFISGIFVFKSALMRSDPVHIKYSSGLYTLIFIFLLVLFIFQRIEINKKIRSLIQAVNQKTISIIIPTFFLIFSSFFILGIFNSNDQVEKKNKVKNILYFKKNILDFIKTEDESYIKNETKLVLEYYKKLSKNDTCVQIFSDDIVFTYFLKKKSCTQFYIPPLIINGSTEEKFINQLKKLLPNIILYQSPTKILSNPNMSNALKYINEKYIFFSDYNGYIFYKLK